MIKSLSPEKLKQGKTDRAERSNLFYFKWS